MNIASDEVLAHITVVYSRTIYIILNNIFVIKIKELFRKIVYVYELIWRGARKENFTAFVVKVQFSDKSSLETADNSSARRKFEELYRKQFAVEAML